MVLFLNFSILSLLEKFFHIKLACCLVSTLCLSLNLSKTRQLSVSQSANLKCGTYSTLGYHLLPVKI
jgi:hypothetical protein